MSDLDLLPLQGSEAQIESKGDRFFSVHQFEEVIRENLNGNSAIVEYVD